MGRILKPGEEPNQPSTDQAGAAEAEAEGRDAAAGGIRWKLMNCFVDKSMRHLEPSETAVWFGLFRSCRDGRVTVSQQRIADLTGLSRRTVTRAVRRLKKLGLAEVLVQGKDFLGKASTYILRATIRETAPDNEEFVSEDMVWVP